MVKQFTSTNGLIITVGENAKENDEIRKRASQKDMWFHLEDVASPHVILKYTKLKSIKEDFAQADIEDAAQLCKLYSKQKSMDRSIVIYINVKKVKKVENIDGRCELAAKPDRMVVYENEDAINRLRQTMVA